MTKAKRKTADGANHICRSMQLLFAGIAKRRGTDKKMARSAGIDKERNPTYGG